MTELVTGCVLAGGHSKRMGEDKALLELDGTPMALRAVQVLRASGCQVVAVVGPSHLAALGTLHWDDGPGPRHPLRGLAHALQTAQSPWLMCCPCDLPGLKPEHLRLLMAVDGPAVARGPDGLHPLVAKLPTGWASRAQDLMSEGASARALVAPCTPVDLPASALLDCNRPEDLLGHRSG